MNYAMSMMATEKSDVDVTEYQERFYTYLGALATYNTMTQQELSYDDFANGNNEAAYETAFGILNTQADMNLSTEGFQSAIDGLSQSGIGLEKYVEQFEYVYALKQSEGVFNKEELTASGMLTITLDMMGAVSYTHLGIVPIAGHDDY